MSDERGPWPMVDQDADARSGQRLVSFPASLQVPGVNGVLVQLIPTDQPGLDYRKVVVVLCVDDAMRDRLHEEAEMIRRSLR
jgi:hypothetical protein